MFVLARIRETATKAIDSMEKAKKRKTPPTTATGFDLEHDWTDLITRVE